MKVTAILDEKLIKEAMKYAKAATITDALRVALKEYISLKKLNELGKKVKSKPLQFKYTSEELRGINRES